jgi:hypothetical protein
MTKRITKEMLSAANMPDTPTARKVLARMLDDDDIQEYVRPWKGLTDGEMLECLKAVDVATAVNLLMSQYEMPPTFKVYAQAIEAKLKEKNA